LDFAVQHSLPQELIEQEMDKICDFVQANNGVVFDKEKNRVSEKQRIDKDKKVYEVQQKRRNRIPVQQLRFAPQRLRYQIQRF
jgi:hypothetical protein